MLLDKKDEFKKSVLHLKLKKTNTHTYKLIFYYRVAYSSKVMIIKKSKQQIIIR